jgi:HK97 family phage prohead protease
MTTKLRAAIAPHQTPTTDQAYDPSIMLAHCPAEASALQTMHAWRDGGRSATDSTNYKVPHHVVSQDGQVGAASTMACRDGIATLNQPDNGGIPGSDVQGVYDHLAAHLVDAGMVPSELNSLRARRGLEQRRSLAPEVRVISEGGITKISGHAAVFNQLSDPINDYWEPFRERIAGGAFAKTIQEADVPALWNHNADFPLARNKAGTLTLREDEIGLYYEFPPPDTSYGRDLVENIRTGNVTGNSFGFVCIRDRWDVQADEEVRTLLEVQLWDISPVTYPAYPQTDIGMRQSSIDWRAIDLIVARRSRGLAIPKRDREFIAATIEKLRSIQDEPTQPSHSPEANVAEPVRQGHSVARRRRELELLALSS